MPIGSHAPARSRSGGTLGRHWERVTKEIGGSARAGDRTTPMHGRKVARDSQQRQEIAPRLPGDSCSLRARLISLHPRNAELYQAWCLPFSRDADDRTKTIGTKTSHSHPRDHHASQNRRERFESVSRGPREAVRAAAGRA